eukprot:Lankesteria_metandrocarpae@DN8502_c0_g1_i1.p1
MTLFTTKKLHTDTNNGWKHVTAIFSFSINRCSMHSPFEVVTAYFRLPYLLRFLAIRHGTDLDCWTKEGHSIKKSSSAELKKTFISPATDKKSVLASSSILQSEFVLAAVDPVNTEDCPLSPLITSLSTRLASDS